GRLGGGQGQHREGQGRGTRHGRESLGPHGRPPLEPPKGGVSPVVLSPREVLLRASPRRPGPWPALPRRRRAEPSGPRTGSPTGAGAAAPPVRGGARPTAGRARGRSRPAGPGFRGEADGPSPDDRASSARARGC